jgi:hypothetical protein
MRKPEPIEIEYDRSALAVLPDGILRRLAEEIAKDLAAGKKLNPRRLAARVVPSVEPELSAK